MYDYVIVGAGIAGSAIAYELQKYTNNILLIDKNSSIAAGASGAAGAFLSPLLGKPNDFKGLVNNALKYSVDFYKQNFSEHINNCGTLRIPKDKNAALQFDSYVPYIDFEFQPKQGGYFFPIGSVVNSKQICTNLTSNIEKLFSTEIKTIEYADGIYTLNHTIKTKNLILTTGHCTKLLNESYVGIRAVWGQRIDIKTTSCIPFNYHKSCSLSVSKQFDRNTNIVSIGATHHRFVDDKKIDKSDTKKLLDLACDIVPLENVEVIKEVAGARASSVDYFPIVGKVVDSKSTLEKYPYIKKGSKVPKEDYITYPNLYILNGLGGRGFVLAPYLSNQLSKYIYHDNTVDEHIQIHRLFQRWARKQQ